jgi:2',3'-cyclic-nucleotide 2'-phosphodiesterase (5'-nucleotidase family)
MGGLSRRATVIQNARTNGPTFVVDAGDLAWKTETIAANRLDQQRAKAALQFKAYALAGIDAMVPGDGDMALGLDWLAEQATQHSLPYVAANLVCEGLAMPSSRIVERDGVRIGFIGVVGPGQAGPCQATSTVPAVVRAVKEMGTVDLTVLLSHQAAAEDMSLSNAIPDIDVIVNGQSRQQHRLPEKLSASAVQLSNGTRGKKLGVAQLVLVSDAAGWLLDGAIAQQETQLRSIRSRRDRTQERVGVAKSDKEKTRAEQRVRRLDKQVADIEAQISAARVLTAEPQHRISNTLVGLDDEI